MSFESELLVKIKALTKDIEQEAKKGVYVGIPTTKTTRKKGEHINNSEIGYINEFGSPLHNIPPRPFLYPTLEREKQKVISLMNTNEIFAIAQNLNKVGLYLSSEIRKTITEQIGFTPLSPKTIKARQRKRVSGEAGEKALIDTGQLRQAITYIIK